MGKAFRKRWCCTIGISDTALDTLIVQYGLHSRQDAKPHAAQEGSPTLISHKPQQQQKANCNETPQYNPIPPLLRPNPPNQTIQPGNLTRRPDDPPVDARQRLPLRPETLINRIRLAQHPVRDTVTPIDPVPLVEHVVRFRVGRVRVPVGGDVGADGGEEVGALAGGGEGGLEAEELAAVGEEGFTVAG